MGNIKKVLIVSNYCVSPYSAQEDLNNAIGSMIYDDLDIEILVSSQGGGIGGGITFWTVIGREKEIK